MNKKIKIILVVSLMLNMLLGGFVVGEAVKIASKQQRGSSVVREFRKEHKAERDALKVERTKALEMIRADVFDADAFAAQIDIVSLMQEKMYRQFTVEMAEKMRAMPVEERNKLVQRVIDKQTRGDKKRKAGKE